MLPAEGTLLVNLGDALARWTNDRWRSTLHRVLPPADSEGRLLRRRSAAYFHDGNHDAVISPLPGCVPAGSEPLYPPLTVGDHIAAKLSGSRALRPNDDAARESARLLAADRAHSATGAATGAEGTRRSTVPADGARRVPSAPVAAPVAAVGSVGGEQPCALPRGVVVRPQGAGARQLGRDVVAYGERRVERLAARRDAAGERADDGVMVAVVEVGGGAAP
ncbi:2OG-Fe(II) oxygenase family protein [Streptomyces albus]|uniref:2OG-Fe(II) oxygenase family protein n=1 Tax=Streptomyces albus TaxID=1888 RepID=UPI0024E170BA|nr:2OG-Fe(II) oxygenase family protein [Streptomyces albus]